MLPLWAALSPSPGQGLSEPLLGAGTAVSPLGGHKGGAELPEGHTQHSVACRETPTLGGAGGDVGRGPAGRMVLLAEWAPSLQQKQGVSRAEVPKASWSPGSTEQWRPPAGGRGKAEPGGGRCSAVRQPGLGPTSTAGWTSGLALSRPQLPQPYSGNSPNTPSRAVVSLLAGGSPQGGRCSHLPCSRTFLASPRSVLPSVPTSGTNRDPSTSRLPLPRDHLFHTHAKHGLNTQ